VFFLGCSWSWSSKYSSSDHIHVQYKRKRQYRCTIQMACTSFKRFQRNHIDFFSYYLFFFCKKKQIYDFSSLKHPQYNYRNNLKIQNILRGVYVERYLLIGSAFRMAHTTQKFLIIFLLDNSVSDLDFDHYFTNFASQKVFYHSYINDRVLFSIEHH
jgi:hypothetical protein